LQQLTRHLLELAALSVKIWIFCRENLREMQENEEFPGETLFSSDICQCGN